MTRRERDRLRDIKDAITAIREHLAGAEQAPAQKDSRDRPAASRAVADR